ncbi:MAG TPA: hypothetical protein VGJ60_16575 [Chloroflexota bacterium]|jgi:hypothetical protein
MKTDLATTPLSADDVRSRIAEVKRLRAALLLHHDESLDDVCDLCGLSG